MKPAANHLIVLCLHAAMLSLRSCNGFYIGQQAFSSNQRNSSTKRYLMQSTLNRSRSGSSKLMQDSNANTDTKKTVRILCLHGKGGNGEKFVNIALGPLRRLVDSRLEQADAEQRISFEWYSITAPYEIPSGRIQSDENKGYSWWSMPPGVRSFDAEEYVGFKDSEALVMNTMYSKDNHCNYDIVIGHSQGAILTAALLSVNSKLWTDDNSPTGYIFNGVAWPNPFESYMQGLTQQVKQHQSNNSQLPPMLFIMGKLDDINPIQSAKQVSDAFSVAGFNVAIVEHDGGHSVPYKSDDDSKRALEEVVDWIMRIAEQSKIQL